MYIVDTVRPFPVNNFVYLVLFFPNVKLGPEASAARSTLHQPFSQKKLQNL